MKSNLTKKHVALTSFIFHLIFNQFGGGSFPIRIKKGFEGDDDNDDEDDIEELEGKIKAAELPEHALKVAMKELKVSFPFSNPQQT